MPKLLARGRNLGDATERAQDFDQTSKNLLIQEELESRYKEVVVLNSREGLHQGWSREERMSSQQGPLCY